ncbi:MAG TPA: hypothetical protein VIW69_18870 [Candidatus Elarobacter sp.]
MSADSEAARAERAERRRQIGVARKIRLHEDDGSFDDEFWSAIDPSERMRLNWEMVVEYHAANRRDPAELRLRRSVVIVGVHEGHRSARRSKS